MAAAELALSRAQRVRSRPQAPQAGGRRLWSRRLHAWGRPLGACPNLAGGLAWMVGWRCERATWATMRAGPRWLAIPTCITIAGGERAVMARAVKWAPSRALGVRVTVTKPPASSTAMAPTGAAGPIAGRHTSLTALAARCCAPAGIVPGASSARRLGAYFRFDTDGLRTAQSALWIVLRSHLQPLTVCGNRKLTAVSHRAVTMC